jgi:DNA repair protein RadC
MKPQEKLLAYGVEQLTFSELCALLIRTGHKGKSARQVAEELTPLINKHKNNISPSIFSGIRGIGCAKISTICAALELGHRLYGNKSTKLIVRPKDVWLLMRDEVQKKKEYFVVFYLNTRNQVIQKELISIGSLSASIAHPREVFEPAVRHHAGQIILSHNHPSGDSTPSSEDRETTIRLVKAGELLGIEVVDHVVVSREGFTSMKEKRMM